MTHTLDDILAPDDLDQLARRYGGVRREHHVMQTGEDWCRRYADRKLRTRRGEVLCVLENPAGEVLLHTTRKYPEGVYRLLSGGIAWRESVLDALRREMHEETGFRIEGEELLGLLTYEFCAGDLVVPFASYVFRVTGVVGEPEVQDPSEGITGFSWVPAEDLSRVAASLRDLPVGFRGRGDWGEFRALGHDFVHGALVPR